MFKRNLPGLPSEQALFTRVYEHVERGFKTTLKVHKHFEIGSSNLRAIIQQD